jgi:hypothetical protein
VWWLGFLELQAGHADLATEYLEEALAILVQFLPADHPEIARLRGHLDLVRGSATSGNMVQ